MRPFVVGETTTGWLIPQIGVTDNLPTYHTPALGDMVIEATTTYPLVTILIPKATFEANYTAVF